MAGVERSRSLTNERIHTAYHLGPNIFSIIDLKENLALYWVKDAQALPYYEIGSPLRTILHWWADQGAYQFVHGGAVGLPTGGVLLAGKGGTGKSTTALACLEAGLLYASDDYCLIRTDTEPFVYSIYNTAKLRGDLDLERFPAWLRSSATRAGWKMTRPCFSCSNIFRAGLPRLPDPGNPAATIDGQAGNPAKTRERRGCPDGPGTLHALAIAGRKRCGDKDNVATGPAGPRICFGIRNGYCKDP